MTALPPGMRRARRGRLILTRRVVVARLDHPHDADERASEDIWCAAGSRLKAWRDCRERVAMPWALVEVRRQWSREGEVAIIDAIHGALVAAFRIPGKDKHVRLQVHEPHRLACPPTLSQPEYAILVSVDCFAGRSVEAKRRLYGEIVERVERLGIPRASAPTVTEPDRSRAQSAHDRTVRSWPLLVLALPAAVAVWSGWAGIGQKTGFGRVQPPPGIWDSLHLDTAVTLPVGVEAYALRAWLSTSNKVSARTRRFAR
jgi:Tautomerase enzyme